MTKYESVSEAVYDILDVADLARDLDPDNPMAYQDFIDECLNELFDTHGENFAEKTNIRINAICARSCGLI